MTKSNASSANELSQLTLQSKKTLNDGNQIPRLGFGVYLSPAGQVTYASVMAALEAGYRHIDTAAIYRNEADVGRAVRDSGIPREQIFVTTKLWNGDQGYDRALRAFDTSLTTLGLESVDLYLIHWPVKDRRRESWRALSEIKRSGRAKSIGVSNYMINHLDELLGESGVVPAINQVEFSPFLYQRDLLDFCTEHRIAIESYAPLTRGERFDHPAIASIARKHAKTPAQVLIRWCLEVDTIPLPKSNTPSRIVENANVFDFSFDAEDRARLDDLNEDLRTSWDPSTAP